MGLFSKKTDEQIIEEARKLYVAGDLSAADLKIVKLARKGNPEACYLAAKIQLEIAKTRKPELYIKSARAFLERAVAAGHKDAAVLMENVFGKSVNTEDKPVKEISEPEAVEPVQEEGTAGGISAEDEQVIAEIATEEKSPVADITINAEGTARAVSEVEEAAETEAIPQVTEKTADKQEKICEDIEESAYDDEDEIAVAEINRAQELLDEGKNAEAKAILEKFAEEGYLAAMLSYANVLAAEDKCDEAMSWVNVVKDSSDDEEILEVADEITADIKTYLHKLFTKGMDMYKNAPFDKSEAIALIKKAAEQGDADAQFYMGEIYHEGKAVETDLDEAAKWYRKAAEQGDEVAEYKLMVLGKE